MRSSIARIKPLSEMVLAMAKAADPKHISSITAAEIHNIKKLADQCIAAETRFFGENEARSRDLEALAIAENDVSQVVLRVTVEEARVLESQLRDVREKLRLIVRAKEREREEAEQSIKSARAQLAVANSQLKERDAEIALLRQKLEDEKQENSRLEDQLKLAGNYAGLTSQMCSLQDLHEEAMQALWNENAKLEEVCTPLNASSPASTLSPCD